MGTKEKELSNYIARYLKYNDYEEMSKVAGISFIVNTHYGNSTICILSIVHTDPLHRSYSDASNINILKASLEDNNAIDVVTLDSIKSRIRAKIKQQKVLEEIRVQGIYEIKAFISDSFDIPIENICIEDIKFDLYNRFIIAGEQFSYSGTIKDRQFKINDNTNYTPYKTIYKKICTIKNYFINKKE